ncbi:MAG: MurR/RpiR family transcriptional regulator [Microvirga sp.]|jgi:DNA-binding MurR/RpiR family transcriptional regulator|nr:MurR/RpiR family transcriptional regulator [Beijerinckiaceae bacterium]
MPADRAREDGADWKAPPRDFERFRELLLDRRDGLPSRLVRAAEYALAHPDEIAFGTVASVAEAAEIQPSALIRFAKALGYNGFSELQEVFRHRLRERWPPYGERLAKLRTEAPDGPAGLLKRFSASSALSLAKLDDTVVPEDLERAVSVLAGAATIHLLGLRRAFPVASYLAYALGKLQVSANLVDHVGALAGEQIGAARDGDALIAVSFTPYTPATIELANAFSAKGFPVVAITDSAFSPLAPAATARIEIVEADVGGFRSLAATFCVAMTLAVAVAERRGER